MMKFQVFFVIGLALSAGGCIAGLGVPAIAPAATVGDVSQPVVPARLDTGTFAFVTATGGGDSADARLADLLPSLALARGLPVATAGTAARYRVKPYLGLRDGAALYVLDIYDETLARARRIEGQVAGAASLDDAALMAIASATVEALAAVFPPIATSTATASAYAPR